MARAPRPLLAAACCAVLAAAAVTVAPAPAHAGPGDVATVAGNGTSSFFDGTTALGNGVGQVRGVAGNERNGAYLAATDLHQVLEFDAASNRVNLVAGTGTPGGSGDGGLAQDAQLNGPTGIVYDRGSGVLLVADTGNHRIRRIQLGGTRAITNLAGTGTPGFAGDGGPAGSAVLSSPSGLARAADGTIYVADTGNHRVRAISTLGTIVTVAGTGAPGFGGDGGPATAAQLDTPRAVAVGADGTVYIADAGNRRVRAVTTSGTITTLVGTGIAGSGGDGGPAGAAQLDEPTSLLVDATGILWIGDRAAAVVRSVQAGIITRRAGVVGVACSTPNGDGGSAAAASLCEPQAIGARSNGDLLVGEAGAGRRLRVVSRVLPGLSGPVQSLTVTGGVGAITVSWNAPADNGGSAVVDYLVRVLVGGTAVTQTVTGTSATVSGLSAGVTYVASVWARTAAGQGAEAQATGSPTSDPPPTVPTSSTTIPSSTLPPPTTAAPTPVGGTPPGGGGGGGGTGGAGGTGGTGGGGSLDAAAPTGSESLVTLGLGALAVSIGIVLVRVAMGRRRADRVPPAPWI